VVSPGGRVRLEPKETEVLAVLGKRPGRMVSRDDPSDGVCPGVVVTEHALNRCVYRLRNELGQIAWPGPLQSIRDASQARLPIAGVRRDVGGERLN
jgi:DNA-binding response OmpR family regulator